MSSRNLVVAGLVASALALPRPARACGPDFPPAWLVDRDATLLDLPDGSFALEASRLVPRPAEAFAVVEDGLEPDGARTGAGVRETSLYQEGAQEFGDGELEGARRKFAAVLALPKAERQRFSTFAAYMLGRTASTPAEARARFAEVRSLVRAGFDDPLGLAVASLGEEARGPLAEGDFATAVALYARQATYGSHVAVTSLLFVARRLVAAGAKERRHALESPVVQRLLAAYAWTRGNDYLWETGEDESHAAPRPRPDLVAELAALPRLAGGDLLAAAAYRAGRFALAARFADRSDTALALWIRGKLALRRGDRARAETLFARASASYPQAESWGDFLEWFELRPRGRIDADRAVTSLARGAFREALDLAVSSGAWRDVAYLAEKVLTVDELVAYVREQHPTATTPRPPCEYPEDREQREKEKEAASSCLPQGESDLGPELRGLLARRLMRTGRFDEAVGFFDDPSLRASAEAYLGHRRTAAVLVDPIYRAQALWLASRVMRERGLQLFGTETAPDWELVDGSYDLGDGGLAPARTQPRVPGAPLVTAAEQARVDASAPPAPSRFHYRATAAALTEEAARLVPRRSQAYATLLCAAAREAPDASRLWGRYVRNGAFTSAIRVFPGDCDAPDFERARHPRPPAPTPVRGPRKRVLVGGATGLLLALGALAVVLRRGAGPASTTTTNP